MRNTRSITMLAVAVLLAFGAVLVAARWINAQAAGTTTRIAIAQVDIGLGARISPEMVKLSDWPANAMPPGAVSDASTLAGRVSRASIVRGEPILEAKLAPPGTQGGLSAVVPEGKRAITVRVNDVVGVAGFALPGNFVDILVNTQDESMKNQSAAHDPSISKIVLERIMVLAVAQESSRDETKPKVVNAVTLEVTPEQAEKLDLARSVGTLSLVLRNQIDPDPSKTAGATKASLLGKEMIVEQKTADAKPLPPKRVAVTAQPKGERVEVIKGLERSTQQF